MRAAGFLQVFFADLIAKRLPDEWVVNLISMQKPKQVLTAEEDDTAAGLSQKTDEFIVEPRRRLRAHLPSQPVSKLNRF